MWTDHIVRVTSVTLDMPVKAFLQTPGFAMMCVYCSIYSLSPFTPFGSSAPSNNVQPTEASIGRQSFPHPSINLSPSCQFVVTADWPSKCVFPRCLGLTRWQCLHPQWRTDAFPLRQLVYAGTKAAIEPGWLKPVFFWSWIKDVLLDFELFQSIASEGVGWDPYLEQESLQALEHYFWSHKLESHGKPLSPKITTRSPQQME